MKIQNRPLQRLGILPATPEIYLTQPHMRPVGSQSATERRCASSAYLVDGEELPLRAPSTAHHSAAQAQAPWASPQHKPYFSAARHAAACLAFVGVVVLVNSNPRDERATARPAMEARMRALENEAEAKVAAARAAELAAQVELAKIRALRGQAAGLPASAAAASTEVPQQQQQQQLRASHAESRRQAAVSISSAALAERFTALCTALAPAVALRPAPAPSLSARLAVEMSPWSWAGSTAKVRL